jgi:hypothetical protein
VITLPERCKWVRISVTTEDPVTKLIRINNYNIY